MISSNIMSPSAAPLLYYNLEPSKPPNPRSKYNSNHTKQRPYSKTNASLVDNWYEEAAFLEMPRATSMPSRHAHAVATPRSKRRRETKATVSYVRNLLGWLRLGWLTIA